MLLEFRPFRASDFPTYQSWFEEQQTRIHLGGIDADWLAHVLTHPEQPEFAIYADGHMVAEIGVVLATKASPYHVITNLCVAPGHRGKGVAQMVLEQLGQAGVVPADACPIRAYVSVDNPGALACFRRARWREHPPEEEMIAFERSGFGD
jgi:ribosomal protein S18 acetylase RimI-like enzyme